MKKMAEIDGIVDFFIRPKTFAEMMGITKSTLYAWVKDGRIPSPVKIGKRATGWPVSQVREVVEKIKASAA